MNVLIKEAILGGTVKAVASKSHAHRFLICASLSNRETFMACPASSGDIDATIRCLQALGAIIERRSDGFNITPISPQLRKRDGLAVLDCGESGSTLRFLLPVCGALGCGVSFIMGGRLPARPLFALYNEMVSHGCVLTEPGNPRLDCEGQLTGGTYTLPGNISSQYISGLLFALPLLNSDSLIRVTGVLESRPYIDMTLETLRSFNIEIHEEDKMSFRIPGGQTYVSPGNVQVEGDWSNAAFWLSAGAIGQNRITCTNLNPASRQGDRAIIEILSRFGADVSVSKNTVTVTPCKLRGIDIDAENIPDLVPVLAAVASKAEGRTVIRNAGRLRLKESDRLRATAASLSSLGADITENDDGLIITGKKTLPGGETDSFGDHRIAMTAAILSSVCAGPALVKNAETVNKSYPGFFDDLAALGAKSAEV
ncbi:MAG: 3-phosphoshikimate 1-carboxyvinyltransferase [Treponema sp.]|nr:3-phosphoshikimate 1-carboxyvinyltransferase [Treponema sp.]